MFLERRSGCLYPSTLRSILMFLPQWQLTVLVVLAPQSHRFLQKLEDTKRWRSGKALVDLGSN